MEKARALHFIVDMKESENYLRMENLKDDYRLATGKGPMIGVFWYHKGTVFGKATHLADGENTGCNFIDSPDTHTDIWDQDRSIRKGFTELYDMDYFEVPRGRVMWDLKDISARILMDSSLFKKAVQKKILQFFHLEKVPVSWGRDNHYTTNIDELSKLFDY